MRTLVALAVLSLTLAACGADAATTDPSAPVASDPPTTTTPTTSPVSQPDPEVEAPETMSDAEVPDPVEPLPEEVRYDHFVRTDTITVGQPPAEHDIEIDIHAPEEIGPWPVVVTVHGGGWFGGNRTSMGLLADGLADRKVVVFNTSYSTISRGGTFPGMVDDVACAVQHARIHASEFTSTPRLVTIVGHSAGAHLASLVAYAPAEFGRACPEGPMQGPDALVGLAGPYDISALDFLLTSIEHYRDAGNEFGRGWGHFEVGNMSRRIGKLKTAWHHLSEGLTLFASHRDVSAAVLFLAGFAGIAKALGDESRAVTLAGAYHGFRLTSGVEIVDYEINHIEGLEVETLEALTGDLAEDFRRGRAMSFDDAVSYALSQPGGGRTPENLPDE